MEEDTRKDRQTLFEVGLKGNKTAERPASVQYLEMNVEFHKEVEILRALFLPVGD